jgi:2-polyprenyl-3-methyl-5-hydroxy-6-metoxy-1,4-benzoquinol methylase
LPSLQEDRVEDPPPEADLVRTSAYYDRIAREYDGQVDGLAINRAQRDAFRTRVAALAGSGGRILDFGCGTGTDAEWYAAKGHEVVAHDISAGMVEVLRSRCADAIARGRITALVGRLSDLDRVLRGGPPLDVIAANFGVLNHFDDLQQVLALLASHLRPGGALVASVLNPLYKGPARWRSWLKTQATSRWKGGVTLRGEVTTYRPYLRTLRRMARPALALVEVGHVDERGRWSAEPIRFRPVLDEQFRFVVLKRVV